MAENSLDNNVDEFPCGLIKVSESRKIIHSNNYIAELIGIPAADTKKLYIDQLLSAASRIFLDSYVYPLIISDGFANEIQLTLQSCSNEKIPIVANIKVIEGKSSLWTVMACENRDKLYDELISARDKISAYAEELRDLHDQVQRENADLQVFCHSLSHDFISPINQTQMIIDLVVSRFNANGNVGQREIEFLNDANSRMSVMKTLTKGLMDYLFVDALIEAEENVNISDVIRSAIELIGPDDDVKVSFTEIGLPTVFGNAAHLTLMFKNLIANSIKYNTRRPRISISYERDLDSNRELISISDNGIGIAPEYVEEIFAPFSRLHAASEFSGSGLGLSIVKKVLAKHDGEISVRSAVGDGSTFTVSFPVIESVG